MFFKSIQYMKLEEIVRENCSNISFHYSLAPEQYWQKTIDETLDAEELHPPKQQP